MKAAVVGSFVVDLMARTAHLPRPGETVRGTVFSMGPGGKGSNQAIAAKRLGCDLMFSTKVGKDSFANIAMDTFRTNDIELSNVFISQTQPTGCALISVDDTTAQNSIIVVCGACNDYTKAEIDSLLENMEDCQYLLMQLEINMDAVESLAQSAKEKKIKVILNPAPAHELNDELLKGLYLATPNETEASALTGLPCKSPKDCYAIARWFFEHGVNNVIVTLGSTGVYVNDGRQGYLIENYPLKVLDTTGAGDAFSGGLLAALCRGDDLITAAEYANVVSNIAVTRLGTAPAMPTRAAVEVFIQENGTNKARRI